MNIEYICPHCKEHQKIKVIALMSAKYGASSKNVKTAIEAYKCTNCKQTNL